MLCSLAKMPTALRWKGQKLFLSPLAGRGSGRGANQDLYENGAMSVISEQVVSQSNLIAAAGEHYVLCQLLRLGYVAALAPRGAPNTDIVVTDVTTKRLFNIQVKTRQEKGSDGGWHMGKKHETLISVQLFYAFVDFGVNVASPPKTFVVPSSVVAKTISEMHAAWLGSPGQKGQQRKDTDFRRFVPDYTRYAGPNTHYGPGWLQPYAEAWGQLSQ